MSIVKTNKPRLSLRAFTNKTGETRTEIERRGSAMVQAVKRNPVVACIRGNLLTLCTLLGVILGIVVGFVLRASQETKWTPRNIMYIKFVGELFLRMLKMLIVPLIASSLISAVGGLDLSLSKKIGIRAVGYYMITTILAVILGLVLVVVIHPGHGDLDAIQRTGAARNITTVDTLMDLIR
ncbi:unnamed protein product [Cyprideis torosa]|uniref:Amino acid transporter n=1 Tax=Cyprideis torosa TaxID=163714 RepID=A0A7R8W6W2_9CRUS|nr:unnamed protein product [Cyprideis torosa]CAG0884482.1 unnamed protein product [Cyprideis torosa]